METKEVLEATCPDCRGPLSRVGHDQTVIEYRCLVGHTYTARTLLQAHSETQENALWSAVLALEEAEQLVSAVSSELPADVAERLNAQVQLKLEQAMAIRKILERLEPFQTDSLLEP